MEEKKVDQPVKDQVVKQQEDEGDPVVLEVYRAETVGSSSQMG